MLFFPLISPNASGTHHASRIDRSASKLVTIIW
jgi:hypothetical protein